MSLVDDINEMRRVFSKSSLLSKLLILISAFLAMSSLASLSDEIIKWRGFILDAISFYQLYFVSPIKLFGLQIGLEYTTTEIHAAVLMTLAVSVGMRLLVVGQCVAYEKINEQYGGNETPNLILFSAIPFVFTPAIWAWYGFNSKPPNMWSVASVFLFYPTALVLPKLLLSKYFPNNFAFPENGHFSYIKSYYSIVAFLFLIIGVLGAINAAMPK